MVNGSVAEFNCTTTGEPLPSISWFVKGVSSLLPPNAPFNQEGRIDEALISNAVLGNVTVTSTLRLTGADPFLAESFVCVASNVLGNVNKTAVLNVNGKVIVEYNPYLCCSA